MSARASLVGCLRENYKEGLTEFTIEIQQKLIELGYESYDARNDIKLTISIKHDDVRKHFKSLPNLDLPTVVVDMCDQLVELPLFENFKFDVGSGQSEFFMNVTCKILKD